MKKVCLLIIICMVVLFTSVCFAEDTRIVVDKIEAAVVKGKSDLTPVNFDDLFIYGRTINSTVYPTFVISGDGYPAYFYSYYWEKKVGTEWKDAGYLNINKFTAGTWRYKASIYIDEYTEDGSPYAEAGEEYRFSGDVEIIIAGEPWKKMEFSSNSNSSYICAYKEFIMPEPDELTVYDNSSLNIYEAWVNVEIDEIDIGKVVEGGTKPYSYSISGPSWLEISSDGIISGTPSAIADETTATITITDAEDNENSLVIDVCEVLGDPSERTEINSVTVTSSNIDSIPVPGIYCSTHPSFTVTDGYPAYVYNGFWQVKDGGYRRLYDSDVFEEGKYYRFVASLCIDNYTEDGSPLATAGNEYVLASDVVVTYSGEVAETDDYDFGNDWSVIYFYTNEFLALEGDYVIPEGSITVPSLGEIAVGYASAEYTPITLEITNDVDVDGGRFDYELTGRDSSNFEVLLNLDSIDGPDTIEDASQFAIRPVTGLAYGTYSATITLLYDMNGDDIYETTIASADFGVLVDGRPVISTITGELSATLESLAVYGNDVYDFKPTITTLTNVQGGSNIEVVGNHFPGYFYRSSSKWQYKTGEDTWENSPVSTFTVGTWRYAAKIYCDNDGSNGSATGGNDYKVSGDLIVRVDDVLWTVGEYYVTSDSSSVYAYSPEIEILAPDELDFPENGYAVPATYVNTAIPELDVSLYTVGGTAPYTYSKVSGPDWITVSSDGKINGTSTVIGYNDNLVVRVTDSAMNYLEQTIPVGMTRCLSEDRIVISAVIATSNIDAMLEPGNEIERPTFTVSGESYPAYFYRSGSSTYWKMKDGDEWVDPGDTFEDGATYKLHSKIYIDNDGNNGPSETAGYEYVLDSDLTVLVDGREWQLADDVSIQSYYSSVEVWSPEITISSVMLGDLDDNGEITIVDVRLLLQAFINAGADPEWTPAQLAVMDMDGNEEINIVDVRLLLQAFINKI